MTDIGLVTGSTIEENGDGDAPVRMIQTEIGDDTDVQNVELFQASGEDTCPVEDSNVIILDLGNSWKIAIACDDNIVPSVAKGEKKIYSIDPITKLEKSSIHLKNDGSVVIENVLGNIELDVTGKVTINGNLEILV